MTYEPIAPATHRYRHAAEANNGMRLGQSQDKWTASGYSLLQPGHSSHVQAGQHTLWEVDGSLCVTVPALLQSLKDTPWLKRMRLFSEPGVGGAHIPSPTPTPTPAPTPTPQLLLLLLPLQVGVFPMAPAVAAATSPEPQASSL